MFKLTSLRPPKYYTNDLLGTYPASAVSSLILDTHLGMVLGIYLAADFPLTHCLTQPPHGWQ